MEDTHAVCEAPPPITSLWTAAVTPIEHAVCALLELDGCQAAGGAPPRRGPPARAVAAALFLLAAALAAVAVANLTARLVYWINARHGSRVAKVAVGALKELRAAAPDLHPRTRHAWFGARDADASSPPLCVACLGYIAPLSPGQTLQSCAACGVVAHDSCARRVGDTCRPLAIPAPSPRHYWLAAGTSRDEPMVSGAGEGLPPRLCLYCGEPAAGELFFATEPAWRCACCGVLAHVQCFCEAHPALPSVRRRFEELAFGGDAAGRQPLDGGSSPGGVSSPGGGPARPAPLLKRGRPGNGGASSSSLASVASADEDGPAGDGGSGGVGDGSDAGRERQRQLRRRLRIVAAANVEQLDECSLGPLGQVVLPACCVKPARDAAAAAAGSSKAPPRQQQQPPHQQAQQADGRRDAAAAPGAAGATGGGKQGRRRGKRQGGGRKRGSSSWWRRAFAPLPPAWQEWRVEPAPPRGARPVVVFINVKSGPQLGEELRQRFLRLLHPLQVVTLPREAPEPALRLFARVPGVRLLVVGGDGTVGWILSCLDAMAAAARAEGGGGAQAWKPPPVAVLPLGTGNDLARCLGWGGGYGGWRAGGAAGVLAEVAAAPTALLDRWELRFQPSAPPPHPSSLPGLLSPRAAAAGAPAGGRPPPPPPPPPPPTRRAMNNYLGIGVDAKVALEFHRVREAHPSWFQSQVGNKIVYTGMGARDIVEGPALNLRRNLRVECDGEEVEVPPGAEGVLLLNISSYMGGLDLWGGGLDWPRGGGGGGAAAAAAPPQSMCDGVLEVVAVYGSWHLGQLTVGLARAVRLGRGRRVVVTCRAALPMQVDGEPFTAAAGEVAVARAGQALVLRRVASAPAAAAARAVEEVLEGAQAGGVITPAQHYALTRDVAARLQQLF